MKKFIFMAVAVSLAVALAVFGALNIYAQNNTTETEAPKSEIPANTPVTYGYLQQFKEEIKQDIINDVVSQITENSAIEQKQDYQEVSASQGKTIILYPDSEIIYRGGGANVITNSKGENEGITDMSLGKELFSGQPLEYGHIYYASSSESTKAILITGDKAYFTIRGNYEII